MRWLILVVIVAVCLPLGWLVGRMDVPANPEQSQAPAQAAAPREAPTPAAGIQVEARTHERAPAPAPESAPRSAPQREPEPEPVRVIRSGQSAVVSQWTDLASAISESERNGKPILIDFNAEWCGPCKRMKRQLFDDPTHGQAVQTAVIPVSIVDRRREDGRNPSEVEDLYQRFQVDAFPTLIVFSPKTGRATRTQGFGSAEATLAWITEAASAVR